MASAPAPSVSSAPATLSNADILRGSVVSGIANAFINGAIQWFLLRGKAPIPLSVDGIANDQHTVLGTAVPLAVSIAFMPHVLWLTLKHGIFTFGLVVAGAVVWQKFMGSVPVSLATAVVVLGVVAGIVGGVINFMTIRASLLRAA